MIHRPFGLSPVKYEMNKGVGYGIYQEKRIVKSRSFDHN